MPTPTPVPPKPPSPPAPSFETLGLHPEYEQDEGGQWICDVPELPGVIRTAATRDEAAREALALALEVMADRVAHGEL